MHDSRILSLAGKLGWIHIQPLGAKRTLKSVLEYVQLTEEFVEPQLNVVVSTAVSGVPPQRTANNDSLGRGDVRAGKRTKALGTAVSRLPGLLTSSCSLYELNQRRSA